MINYIDLFCGIGGFHQAMDRIEKATGEKTSCLFAADNDQYASTIYKNMYGIEALYDLKSEDTHKYISECIGEKQLDYLFAGFPCQPFSKAGNQEGFNNETKGTLFFEIEKIVERHKPKLILLENVRNLAKHDSGKTWKIIKNKLSDLGYYVDYIIISPNEIPGKRIPALRDRIYIMCYRKDLKINRKCFFEGEKDRLKKEKTSIYNYRNFQKGLSSKYFDVGRTSDIEKEKIEVIEMWNDLYHMLKENDREIISPLWPHYFSAKLDEIDEPDWKKKIIKRNQDFYTKNRDIYDLWYKKHKSIFDKQTRSNQKFEWNAGNYIDDIWKGIIQFRPSGVRVKKPDFIPTLVAITQTPIIGAERRYMKPDEMARLYGFKKINFGKQPIKETYKQLGNTVSVDVVEYLINFMMKTIQE